MDLAKLYEATNKHNNVRLKNDVMNQVNRAQGHFHVPGGLVLDYV